MCFFIDLILFYVRHISNSIWSTSIYGVNSSWTSLYSVIQYLLATFKEKVTKLSKQLNVSTLQLPCNFNTYCILSPCTEKCRFMDKRVREVSRFFVAPPRVFPLSVCERAQVHTPFYPQIPPAQYLSSLSSHLCILAGTDTKSQALPPPLDGGLCLM